MFEAILDAIISVLRLNFPAHKIYDEKIQQGFSKPAFFVRILPVANEFTGRYRREKSLIIDITYFGGDDSNLENYKMADDLGDLFQLVRTTQGVFMPRKHRYQIVDGDLHFMFDIDVVEILKEKEGPVIKEINFNKEV
ncbi:DUF6838 family protein [Bacillus sp. AFS017336]|uniref:phage tail terminator family protein n=1 Tax=Bacillus sp. AFS017336 TaxID=2033489 RepID=UPI000BF1624A|nr:hypothetical protein [Bacillus sp. AFS017336]PEL12669.1 hypothetical protein CN601_06900 [Bacillus sp. AFS017336]